MKRHLVLVALLGLMVGCVTQESKPGRLYQLGAPGASMDVNEKNAICFTDLKWQGDFGYGAVEGSRDKGMIALDGKFYLTGEDGRVSLIDRFAPSPFAVLTFFEARQTANWDKTFNQEELKQQLESLLGNRKVPCAIRIDGEFELVRLYRDDGKSPVEFKQAMGTIIAFWMPDYMKGMSSPGFHFYYLSVDRTQGGGVDQFHPKNVRVEVSPLNTIQVVLPK
jgi:acetolactate decarboxylase